MNRYWMLLVAAVLLLGTAIPASATTYNFFAGDLGDLDHYHYYSWGLRWDIPEGEQIVGASLFFNDIRNWDNNPNDLYVHQLDSARAGVWRGYDRQGGGDYYAGKGPLLVHYEDMDTTARDLTYDFSATDLATLTAFASDGRFGFGFDPDCHYWNNGISLSIETAATPVPAPILLLGTGLIGMAGFRRNFRRRDRSA